MFNIDPDMSTEEIKAYFEALPEEEKHAMVKMIVSGVNALVFDVLAVDQVAKSNGHDMPTEADFTQALMGSNIPQQLH